MICHRGGLGELGGAEKIENESDGKRSGNRGKNIDEVGIFERR